MGAECRQFSNTGTAYLTSERHCPSQHSHQRMQTVRNKSGEYSTGFNSGILQHRYRYPCTLLPSRRSQRCRPDAFAVNEFSSLYFHSLKRRTSREEKQYTDRSCLCARPGLYYRYIKHFVQGESAGPWLQGIPSRPPRQHGRSPPQQL